MLSQCKSTCGNNIICTCSEGCHGMFSVKEWAKFQPDYYASRTVNPCTCQVPFGGMFFTYAFRSYPFAYQVSLGEVFKHSWHFDFLCSASIKVGDWFTERFRLSKHLRNVFSCEARSGV